MWRVPSLAVPENIKSNREKRRIKTQLLSQVYDYIRSGHYVKRFYVTLPLITKHQNHPVLDMDAGRLKILHPRIIEKIYEIVQQGIREKRVVKYMLDEYVEEIQTDLGIEIQDSDRSFHPTDRDISNHIRNAVTMLKKQKQQHETVHVDTVEEDGDDGAVIETEDHQQLSYTTEIVATPSFVEIPSQCDMGLDINVTTVPSNMIYQQPQNVDSQQTAVVSFVESAIVDVNNVATFSEAAKNFLESHEVTSLEDIVVQNGVLHYYHQNATTSIEVPGVEKESQIVVETESMEDTTTNIDEVDTINPDEEVDVVSSISNTAADDGSIVVNVESVSVTENKEQDLSQQQQEIDVSMLIEHCKQNPNPPSPQPLQPSVKKKRYRKWSHRHQRSLQKHLDMKTLLKNEIGSSFAIINQALVNEHDESKLKLVLKKVKVLQKIIQGSDSIKRRNRRNGIHAMVDMDNLSQPENL